MVMKSLLGLLLLSTFFVNTIIAKDPERNLKGFEVIYDGSDLSKLKTSGNWKIQDDGSLYLQPRDGESGWTRYHHYLWLIEGYKDFVFEFEYKHLEAGNSGLYFRASDEADPVNSGFEVQIMDSTGKADEEMGHHDLGGVIKTKGASKNAGKPAGEWNLMKVTLKGTHLKVVLNGITVQDFDLAAEKPEDKDLAEEGLIAIQDHGLPFWVRNLRIKRL